MSQPKNFKEHKRRLREGILVVIGYFQHLIMPEDEGFEDFEAFGGSPKRFKDNEKNRIINGLRRIIAPRKDRDCKK